MKTLEELFNYIIQKSSDYMEAEIWVEYLGCSEEDKTALLHKLQDYYEW